MNANTPQPTSDTPDRKPQKWWQWLLVYPTLIISLWGSIPTLLQYIESQKLGVPFNLVSVAKQQNSLWGSNWQCLKTQDFSHVKNKNNIEVGAIVCPSGDVLLRVKPPEDEETYRWVGLNEFKMKKRYVLLIQEAMAKDRISQALVAQSFPDTICQRWLQQGLLLRRVRYPNGGCFDEVINTFTGAIVRRDPASCSSQC